MRTAPIVLLIFAPLALADDKSEPNDPKAPKAREVKLEVNSRAAAALGPPWTRAQFDKPTKITTEKELAKSIPDKDMLGKVLKQVDLKKEYLLLFAWAGASFDKLSFSAGEDGKDVTFTYTAGSGSNVRSYVRLYAVPKKAKYKVKK